MLEIIEEYEFRELPIYKIEEHILNIEYKFYNEVPHINLVLNSNAIDLIEFEELYKKDIYIPKKSNNLSNSYYGILFKTNILKENYLDYMLCLRLNIIESSFIEYDTEAYYYFKKYQLMILDKG